MKIFIKRNVIPFLILCLFQFVYGSFIENYTKYSWELFTPAFWVGVFLGIFVFGFVSVVLED